MTAAIVLTLQVAAASADQFSVNEAATLAIERLTESFGPLPSRGDIVVPGPWLETTHGMEREAEIVRAIARQWWGERLAFDAAGRDLGEGLVWYLQSRIVEELFDRRWQFRAYALDVRRYFGGFVPWQLRTIPLSRMTIGVARDVFLNRPQTRWRRNVTPTITRAALGFASLEQRHTWPVLERGLRAVATQYGGKTVDLPTFSETLSRALAADVTPFIAAMAGQSEVAARIEGVRTEACAPSPCVRTAVTLRGAGQDEWPVRLRFEHTQQMTTTWRPASGDTLWVESPTPPAAVAIDPDRTNLLDPDYRDNIAVLNPSTTVRVSKWMSQWLVWLQQIMLTYTFLL